MSMLRHLGPDEIVKVLAFGALVVRAREQPEQLVGGSRRRHTLPDLTGAPVEVIGNALLAALIAAHTEDEPRVGDDSDGSCASCTALIDLASHYGDPTGKVWPDPVRRFLADVLDAELVVQGTVTMAGSCQGVSRCQRQPPSSVA